MASWQAESLPSSERAGRKMVKMQRATENPTMQRAWKRRILQGTGERQMLQRAKNPEKGHDSEKDWCQVGLALEETMLVAEPGDIHTGLSPVRGHHVTTRNCEECFPSRRANGKNSTERTEIDRTPHPVFPSERSGGGG